MICVSGGWSVRRRTSLLEMRARQEIRSMRRRHIWKRISGENYEITLVKYLIFFFELYVKLV